VLGPALSAQARGASPGQASTGQATPGQATPGQAEAPKAAERVGDRVPEFAFPEFLNGDGRQTLSAFRGSPLLIDFWGTH